MIPLSHKTSSGGNLVVVKTGAVTPLKSSTTKRQRGSSGGDLVVVKTGAVTPLKFSTTKRQRSMPVN